jgi:hypothetical protein
VYNAKYNQANYEYRKKNFRRVTVDFPFSDYERIKAAADADGLPVNTWIKNAIRAALGPDAAGGAGGDRAGAGEAAPGGDAPGGV